MHTRVAHHSLAAAPSVPWHDSPQPPADALAGCVVLHIEGMPRRLRPVIEQLMVSHLPTPATLTIPGEDPLEANWCTRWYRCAVDNILFLPGVSDDAATGVGCRQVLSGEPAELAALGEAVMDLAHRYGFSARLSAA